MIEPGSLCLPGKHFIDFAISKALMFLSLISRYTNINNHIVIGAVYLQVYSQGGVWAWDKQAGTKPLDQFQVYYFSSGIHVGNL